MSQPFLKCLPSKGKGKEPVMYVVLAIPGGVIYEGSEQGCYDFQEQHEGRSLIMTSGLYRKAVKDLERLNSRRRQLSLPVNSLSVRTLINQLVGSPS